MEIGVGKFTSPLYNRLLITLVEKGNTSISRIQKSIYFIYSKTSLCNICNTDYLFFSVYTEIKSNQMFSPFVIGGAVFGVVAVIVIVFLIVFYLKNGKRFLVKCTRVWIVICKCQGSRKGRWIAISKMPHTSYSING